MGIRNISKSLAGVEDLLLDNQTHTQTRNGSSVDITGIHAGELPYYPSGTGAVERTIGEKLGEVVSVKDFGAVGDGVTDDTEALNLAASHVGQVYFPAGIYTTTSGVRLVHGSRWIGAGNWSGVASTYSTTSTSIIKYTGIGGTNSCVVAISDEAVGTEPAVAESRDMQNISFTNFTVDGNFLAEFGLYTVRAWSNNNLDFVTVTGTLKHGFVAMACWNGAIKNWMAYKNAGCGITLGKDVHGTWLNPNVDQSTCDSFFGYFSGYNGSHLNDFDESADTEKEYGIGIYSSRALTMLNPQAAQNGGAGILISNDFFPTNIIGGYAEFNGASSGATSIWDIWVASKVSSFNIKFDGIRLGTGGAIRLTGTAPSRPEAGVRFHRFPVISEINADWDNYSLIDCARGITFTAALPSEENILYNSAISVKSVGIQAYTTFDATAGSIVSEEAYGCSVVYVSPGIYDVTLSPTLDNNNYTVICHPAANNRVVNISQKTTGGFRIQHHAPPSTMTDSSAVLSLHVIGKRTV